MLNNSTLKFALLATLLTGMISTLARADDDEHRPVAKNKVWQTECGACHVAYPPGMLPAESWRAVMSGLDKHFGSDASMDKASAREIGDFLEKNAGRSRRESSEKPLLHITETRWFKHEHDEVSDRTWKNPKVGSRANCTACHQGAENGNFSEHNIRIPK